MDNIIPATLADAPVAPHYSELFAQVCATLATTVDVATRRNHKRVVRAARGVDFANRAVYAKMLAQVSGDDGRPITDKDRADFVLWLAQESNKVVMMASLAQATMGNSGEDDSNDEGRGF